MKASFRGSVFVTIDLVRLDRLCLTPHCSLDMHSVRCCSVSVKTSFGEGKGICSYKGASWNIFERES